MQIQIDSREKARAIKNIVSYFDKNGIGYYISKLYVGDYMNLDNPRVVVDRKQNLTELCANVCQQHERFRKEIIRANEAGIHLIILVEHGHGIEKLEDVIWWVNPRSVKRVRRADGSWRSIDTKATTGVTLYNILHTMQNKYNIEFRFCNKCDTGREIVRLLEGLHDE